MRILHFLYDEPRNPWLGGGGAIRSFTINKYLARQGHEITMVCGNFPRADPTEARDGFQIRHVGLHHNYFLSRASFGAVCRRVIPTVAFDLVVDDTSAFSFTMPYLRTRKPRIAIVQLLVGSHAVRRYGPLGVGPMLFERFNLRRYSHFIVGSSGLEEGIGAIVGSTSGVHLVPYGVDEELFHAAPEDGDYLLYIGRIDIYHKGLDLLLKAFESIGRQRGDLQLVLAGGGRDLSTLENEVKKHPLKEKIRLVGRVSGTEKIRLLAGCKMVVIPSRLEGWGMVAMEAAACGKATVGTEVPGLSDSIVDGETGLLVAPDRAEDLARGISRLLEDEGLRSRLGTAGRKRATQFDWTRIAQRQESIYRELLR